MSSDNNYKISRIASAYILYDAAIIAEPSLQLFDRDYHTKQQARQSDSVDERAGIGRANVVYFFSDNHSLVLKHYYRGGAVAKIIKDRYLGFDVENSRAFREWRLLKKMFQLGLPVPQAVAAHVEKSLLSYRADLITEEIKDAKTLADVLSEKSIEARQWEKIGSCIKSFHKNNIYHADLNARNILLAGEMPEAGEVYLIDFDNSDFRQNSETWKEANLTRLKRSLLKFKNNQQGFNFNKNDWLALQAGYDAAVSKPAC